MKLYLLDLPKTNKKSVMSVSRVIQGRCRDNSQVGIDYRGGRYRCSPSLQLTPWLKHHQPTKSLKTVHGLVDAINTGLQMCKSTIG